ncbi:MAG: alkaline shock response membrane anchor protein AmaP [Andreesenia angusta]|nr:alkaline shock response membrane anchor protein AmaP [Andreesenia angusta]
MKLIDKTILYISTIILLLISIGLMALPFDILSDSEYKYFAENINGNYFLLLIGAIIFIICIKPILFSRKKRQRECTTPLVGGDLKISDEAIKGIAESAVSKFNGIREYDVEVKFVETGINIFINGTATPGVHIPTMADQIQNAVIETVENSTGMNIKNVNIKISKFLSGNLRASR